MDKAIKDEMRTRVNNVSTGALMGMATGIVVGIIDIALAKPASDIATGWPYYLFVCSFLGLIGGILLGCLHFWWRLCRDILHPEANRLVFWLYWCCSSLPFIAFICWVPWSWIESHWEGLERNHRLLVIGTYLLFTIGPVVTAPLVYWINTKARQRLWLNLSIRVTCLVLAAACFHADRIVLPDLYRNFHFGLAGGVVAFLFAFWEVPTPDRFAMRIKRVYPCILATISFAFLLITVILNASKGRAWADSDTLLFSKAVTVVDKIGDVDGDGFSPFLGGSDCNPFNALVGPNRFDFPGNGIDEDCSGKDTKWPDPLTTQTAPWTFAKPPNIVLITVDALRADHVSAYGYKRKTTPVLDKLASEGLRFSNAYSQAPQTVDSVPSMMTGLYPSNLPRDYLCRRAKRLGKPYSYYLTEDVPLLAERLKAKGYTTQGYVSLHVLWTLGLDRGFDGFTVEGPQNRLVDEFIKTVENEPFFLWIHYNYTHAPYVRRGKINFGSSSIDRYDSEIARTDEVIGNVLKTVQDRGLRDNTLFIVTADHGEEFRDHGGTFHGSKLYNELIHVPLIISGPQISRAVVGTYVELVDLVPTLVLALQIGTNPNEFDGESLFDAIDGHRKSRGAYSECYNRESEELLFSLKESRWHYIYNQGNGREELYDVKADIGEQKNVAIHHPDVVSALREESNSRPLRREGIAFRELARTDDVSSFARNLWIFRREALLLGVLDEVGKRKDISAIDSELATLASRPLLQQSVIDRIQTLRSRIAAEPKKPSHKPSHKRSHKRSKKRS
jgi:arylsulfatase A-like enzyme